MEEQQPSDFQFCQPGSKVFITNRVRHCFSNTQSQAGPAFFTKLRCQGAIQPPSQPVIPPSALVCKNAACERARDVLVNSMDPSVDPCEDFYQYACGGFLKSAKIPDDNYIVDYQPEGMWIERLKLLLEAPRSNDEPFVFEMMRKYYRSCLNMDTYGSEEMTTLKDLLSKAGGWPLLAGSGWETGQGANFTWWGMEAKAKELGITLGMLGRSSLLTLSQYSKDGIFPPKLSIFHSKRYGREAWQKLL